MRIDFFSAPLLVSVVFANTIPAQTVRSMTKLDTTSEVYFAAICNGGENVAGVDREKGILVLSKANPSCERFQLTDSMLAQVVFASWCRLIVAVTTHQTLHSTIRIDATDVLASENTNKNGAP